MVTGRHTIVIISFGTIHPFPVAQQPRAAVKIKDVNPMALLLIPSSGGHSKLTSIRGKNELPKLPFLNGHIYLLLAEHFHAILGNQDSIIFF